MLFFNPVKFYDGYRRKFGPLNKGQISGLNAMLEAVSQDPDFDIVKQFAYALATVKTETAHTFLPIREIGKGRGKAYGKADNRTGQIYYGRGLVQLTWYENYKLFKDLLDLPLLTNPDLTMDTDVAWQILSLGMREGLFRKRDKGKGKPYRLSDFIPSDHAPAKYYEARSIINAIVKAVALEIAEDAKDFEEILFKAQVEAPVEISRSEVLLESSDVNFETPSIENQPIAEAQEPSESLRDTVTPQDTRIASQVISEAQGSSQSPGESPAQPPSQTQAVAVGGDVPGPIISGPFDKPITLVKDNSGKLMNWFMGISGTGTVVGFLKDNITLIVVFFLAGAVIGLAVYFVNRYMKIKEADLLADPYKYNVKFVSSGTKIAGEETQVRSDKEAPSPAPVSL